MVATRRGLGRGLEALLNSTAETPAQNENSPDTIQEIPLSSIAPNPFQPRRSFSEESLQELAQSIRAQGVLQPILVRSLPADSAAAETQQRFELIAGERRLRAAKLCALESIPAIVRAMTDEQSLILAMIENLQREDLNPIDEAFGLSNLQQRLASTQDELAKTVGKSRPAVANALRLLQLPQEVQDAVRESSLSAGHARALLGIEDPALLLQAFHHILAERFSVRQTEQLVAYIREHNELPQENSNVPAKKPTKKSPEIERDAELLELATELSEHLAVNVRLQGTNDKGKIVLSFENNQQLKDLLARLGLQQ